MKTYDNFNDFSNNKIINITAGEEYQLHVIDENSDISKDFFYDVHCSAFKEVIKIINENKIQDNEKIQKNIVETSNNIICFCGERGQGKSSAMLSFSRILNNINNHNINRYFNEYTNQLRDKRFHILSRIDPTELENEQSILKVILSRMFFDFKNYLNQNNVLTMPNEMLDNFQKCYKNINLIKNIETVQKEQIYEDDLEALSNLSDSANIKNDFYNLINQFLCFMGGKDWLVIQIDDTDLNVNNAYNIVEDIRKYFMIPKVIVLMATKMDQLTKAIEQSYIKSFDYLHKAEGVFLCDFHQMATKYIEKLIPGSREIILPEISLGDVSDSYKNLYLQYVKTDGTTILSGLLQEKVLEFIYRKTGIIFVKPENSSHSIIPKTARGLSNFLSILNSMEDIKQVTSFKDLEDVDAYLRLENITRFEEYFFNTWIEENVNVAFVQMLKELMKSPWETKNKLIILNILEYKLYSDLNVEKSSVYGVLKLDSNNEENTISPTFDISNVLEIVQKLDDYYPRIDSRNFHFAIRTLYSIMLNKLVLNQILEKEDYAVDLIGDVYGNRVNAFIAKEHNKYNRAKFSFVLTRDDYLDWYVGINPFEIILDRLFLKNAPVTGEKKGGSIECTFNIASLLTRSLQPAEEIMDGIDAKQDNDLLYFKEKYENMRYACFHIISNIDVLQKLEKDLSSKQRFWLYDSTESHIVRFFQRIEDSFNDIGYVTKLEEPFEALINIVKNSKKWVSFVFNQRYSDANTYVKKYSKNLQPYHNTDSFESLQSRLIETQKTFNEIMELNIIDLSQENQEIRKWIDKLDRDRNLSPSTYKKRQAVINKLRKAVLEKIKDLEE